jgi:transcription termination/antitermination protein NusG
VTEENQFPKKRWYVVQAYSGYEAFVKKALEELIVQDDMQIHFGEILVPTEEIVEMKSGQKRKSERKFFPGYVLIEMSMHDASWHLIKSAPKVIGFIGGTSDRPAPISPKEAETILQRMQDSVDQPKPKVLFETGEVVRIVEGPFADFNGVVEEADYDKSRLRVAVLILGRSTPVDLEFGQVEKAD